MHNAGTPSGPNPQKLNAMEWSTYAFWTAAEKRADALHTGPDAHNRKHIISPVLRSHNSELRGLLYRPHSGNYIRHPTAANAWSRVHVAVRWAQH